MIGNMKKYSLVLILFLSLLMQPGCKNKDTGTVSNEKEKTTIPVSVPDFNSDSAYAYVVAQVGFGPRVPNTEAHRSCGDYLVAALKRFGATVQVQEAKLTAYNGDRLNARNIIGSYNSDNSRRILLFAHWDTRPYADHDPNPDKWRDPIDGADDGASGVGALLEICRQLDRSNPGIGVDVIFFDAEDYGTPRFITENSTRESWCLGSQYWSTNPHIANYRAEYGILLDMVGSRNATFFKETTSLESAPEIVEKVWDAARNLGYGKYFFNEEGGGVLDDHTFVIEGRNIPCIDIINYDPESTHRFGAYWHTHNDKLDNIDRNTLKAVGQTVLEVVYKEVEK